MTTYVAVELTDKRTRGKFKCSGFMETKYFMYTEVVANHFLYQHQVDEKKGGIHKNTLIELGLPNIGLVVALLGTSRYQK